MLQLPRSPGESRRCVYGRSAEECEAKYARALGFGEVEVRPGSISEFVIQHFAGWQASRMQADSFRRYDTIWRIQIGPHVGHMLFSELTPEAIQQALHSGKSGSVQNLAKSLLGQIVNLAIVHGWADHRHAVMVKMARVKPPAKRQREDIVQKASALLERVEAAGHWIEGPVWIAMTLGLRKAEVCGLKIGDIDRAKSRINLRNQRSHRAGERQRLKHRQEGDSRRIAVPPMILDRLVSYHKPGTIYLFTDESGKPIPYQHLDRPMEQFQDAENRITFHDLRSAAVTRLRAMGVNPETIMAIVGHRDIDQTTDYVGQDDNQTREALAGLVRGRSI